MSTRFFFLFVCLFFLCVVKEGEKSGLGFEIPFDGSAISGGGFFSICCAGFIWFKGCSCESGCHCSHVCSDPPIVGTAITELQVRLLTIFPCFSLAVLPGFLASRR